MTSSDGKWFFIPMRATDNTVITVHQSEPFESNVVDAIHELSHYIEECEREGRALDPRTVRGFLRIAVELAKDAGIEPLRTRYGEQG